MGMILRSTRPEDAVVEAEMRQWFRDNFGAEDSTALIDWVWENHRDGVRFVDALVTIARETSENGKGFAQNLIDLAKKPRATREAETEIVAWVTPRIEKAAAIVRGHRGDPSVARAEFDGLMIELEAKLRRMFPDVHRALMKGAMASSLRMVDGKFSVDVAALVKALQLPDPLAATARASW
jgi:hypothetical protein